MGAAMTNGRKRMKKVVGAGATALMVAALLTGCENKCGFKYISGPCEPCGPGTATVECTPAATSAKVARVVTVENGIPCIAVMPFQCVEENPESGYLVADALAASLSTIGGCVVYSPEVVASRMSFTDGDPIDPVEVGRTLDAPYILTGRVTEYGQPNQGAVGVTARLIDSRSGQEVWTAKQYQEYMNGNNTLSGWSEAVSHDVARAINLEVPPSVQPVPMPVPVPVPMPAPAAVPLSSTVEVDVHEYVLDEMVEVSSSGPLLPIPPPRDGALRFGSDIEPMDFGVEPEPVRSGPIGEEYGVVAGSPVTARYGTPTLPTDEVGMILDRFEDPMPPRDVTPADVMALTTYQYESGTGDWYSAESAPAAVAAVTTVETTTQYVPEAKASYSVAVPSMNSPVDLPSDLPADLVGVTTTTTVVTETYGSGVAVGYEAWQQDKYTEFHYTGASPFADRGGKAVTEAPQNVDGLYAAVSAINARAVVDVSDTAEPDGLLEEYGDDQYYDAYAFDEFGAAEEEEYATGETMYMPEPPGLPGDLTAMPEEPALLSMPLALEAPALSDMSAMAAPEMPAAESTESLFMPEPLELEPAPRAEFREVKPSEDGSFKVTITAEQFLDDEQFDFFGTLSDQLEDVDDIKG